jgi:hypothetical protein
MQEIWQSCCRAMRLGDSRRPNLLHLGVVFVRMRR